MLYEAQLMLRCALSCVGDAEVIVLVHWLNQLDTIRG